MRLQIAVLIVTVVALSSCGSPDDYAKLSAEKAVAARLKDPPTARFSNEFVVRKPVAKNGQQELATCGVVDGKNSFGGYTGGTRFVVIQMQWFKPAEPSFDNVYVTIDDGDRRAALGEPAHQTAFEKVSWNESCVDADHPATFTAQSEDN